MGHLITGDSSSCQRLETVEELKEKQEREKEAWMGKIRRSKRITQEQTINLHPYLVHILSDDLSP